MTNCQKCHTTFQVTDQELQLLTKLKVQVSDQQFAIPEPTFCPDCRLQRRMVWRNDRKLYERQCDHSGQRLITMFAPDSNTSVINKDIWYSDEWDGRKYGRDFDFDRPFFDQFDELLRDTPLPHIMIHSDENSLYTNYTYANKNCYLCFAGNYLEDSLYCYNAENSRDCVDCLFVFDSELCYECVHSTHCYNSKYLLHCRSCRDSAFLEDCTNCTNCFMCWNLNGQEYCFMNKKYSPEEYAEITAKFSLQTPEKIQQALEYWQTERPNHEKPDNHNISAEDCSGEYILNSKNCHDCYIMGKNCEDCSHILNGFPGLKDSSHCCYSGEKTSLLYECMASGENCYQMTFCNLCFVNCQNLYYSFVLTSSSNCFGCISLRGAEYCILNKQYSQAEYEQMIPRIIAHMQKTGEWGEFPPAKISPFGYNESLAPDFFPLTEEDAKQQGFKWRAAQPEKDPTGQYTKCASCSDEFKITETENKFYQKMGLPQPGNCFTCRHKRRLSIRSPRTTSP